MPPTRRLPALLLALTLSAAAETPPRRVVSINLCSDQLLLLLGEPGQIVSLSYLARDPNASALAERARAYPANHADLEELIAMQPDLVLTGAYTDSALRRALRALGYHLEALPLAHDIATIRANIRRVANWLGHPARGEALIQRLDARLKRLAQKRFKRHPRALFYQPNGYTAGAGTLQDEALKRAGWDNLAARIGLRGYRPIDLETLLLAHPEQFFTSPYAPGTDSLAQRRLRHPALRAATGGRPMIELPYRYWLCGGPMIADAITALQQAHP